VGSREGLGFQGECDECPKGHYCSGGRAIRCGLNYFNTKSGSDSQDDCKLCPSLSSTSQTAVTRLVDCGCNPSYYNANESGVDCRSCPIGTSCTATGTTLRELPLKRGYYRPAALSVDVRRCPDWRANCSSGGEAECSYSSSGCRSGADPDTPCLQGLTGHFCLRCINTTGQYYSKATDNEAAQCKPCGDTLSGTVSLCAGALVMVAILILGWRRYVLPRWHRWPARLRQIAVAVSLPSKLKIVVGFFMIATKVDRVYVRPAASRTCGLATPLS
jgi:hypothetical protein